MNTIAKAILISTVIALPGFSTNAYSHQQGNSGSGMMMDPHMMGQQMMNMRQQRQRNHELMEEIMAEENAEKREQMLRQHMESMQQQMQGMHMMMGDGHMGGAPCADKDKRMEMMDMRMNMMQMMMEQMMEHQSQVE
jgi:hypothetical protein